MATLELVGIDDGQIHQLLHGYNRGHRRLAGSIELPRESALLVDILSDLSGSSRSQGFETYLTAYPLPTVPLIALARTWVADEMPRPGCVWTHTLLIPEHILALIPNLKALNNLFRRPQEENFFSYNRTIQPITSSPVERARHHPLTMQMMWSLYGHPSQQVWVGAESAEDCESVVLDIWSQQWPHLRRSFRFCTGALEDRQTTERLPAFDLQIMPWRSARRGLHDKKGPIVLSVMDQRGRLPAFDDTRNDQAGTWLRLAVNDLATQGETPLRQWLAFFGGDAREPRASFAPLTDIFVAFSAPVNGSAKPGRVLESIRKWYPIPSHAHRLKTTLFADSGPYSLGSLHISDRELLSGLARDANSSVLDASGLRLEQRAQRVASTDSSFLVEFVRTPIASNEVGRAVFRGALLGSTVEQLCALVSRDPMRLNDVVELRPGFASEPALWATSPNAIPELTAKLFLEGLEPENSAVLVEIAYEMGHKDSAAMLALHFPVARMALLNALSRKPTARPENNLITQVFTTFPDEVAAWLQTNPDRSSSVAMIAVATLDPQLPALQTVSSVVWEHLLEIAVSSNRWRLEVSIFVYCLSLQSNRPRAAALALKVFPHLVKAAKDDRLDVAHRQTIAKCAGINRTESSSSLEMLYESLALAFAFKPWDSSFIPEAVSSSKWLKYVLRRMDVLGARQKVDHLVRSVESRRQLVTQKQRNAIRQMRPKSWLSELFNM